MHLIRKKTIIFLMCYFILQIGNKKQLFLSGNQTDSFSLAGYMTDIDCITGQLRQELVA